VKPAVFSHSPCAVMVVVYRVTCMHQTEATFNGHSPLPTFSLMHPYNIIGNENLPCNFLFFYYFSLLPSLSDISQYIEFLFM
jgi:hypothetical protein